MGFSLWERNVWEKKNRAHCIKYRLLLFSWMRVAHNVIIHSCYTRRSTMLLLLIQCWYYSLHDKAVACCPSIPYTSMKHPIDTSLFVFFTRLTIEHSDMNERMNDRTHRCAYRRSDERIKMNKCMRTAMDGDGHLKSISCMYEYLHFRYGFIHFNISHMMLWCCMSIILLFLFLTLRVHRTIWLLCSYGWKMKQR